MVNLFFKEGNLMDNDTILSVWNKTKFFNDNYRLDECGALIKFEDYGQRNSIYGWEIDHITPKSKGGKDILSNYRALHWNNNASRQIGRLNIASPKVKAFIKNKNTNTYQNAIKGEDGKYHWLE